MVHANIMCFFLPKGRVSELSGNEGLSESSSASHDSGGPLLKRRKRQVYT